ILSRATTLTAPLGNDTVHSFQRLATSDPLAPNYDVLDQYYQGSASSNVVLKTVQTVYQTTNEVLHLPLSVTTTWNQQGGLISRVETDYYVYSPASGVYQSWGNVTEKREFGFGTSSWGALARKTNYQYAHISGNTGYNVNYLNLGIADRMTQKTVWDGPTSQKMSDAKTVYDGTAVTTTTGVPNHDYTIGTYRGNPTQSSAWLNPGNTWLNTNNTFNDLGHVLSTTDPRRHTTTFSYADSWSGASCGGGSNTQAYLTQTSAPDTV